VRNLRGEFGRLRFQHQGLDRYSREPEMDNRALVAWEPKFAGLGSFENGNPADCL